MTVLQAYRFALNPTSAQERMLRSHAGAARFAWNWGLARCRERHTAEGKWYSGIDLHRLWNAEKKADPTLAEDLNVAGMTRNRRLARAIADAGFGQARRMLSYKTAWNSGRLILAARFYPSSKKCSGCGAVKTKLALSERTYRCAACGLVLDRDVNAARNLLGLAVSGTERVNACGGMVRPRRTRHVPVNQEPGTAYAGKTGTASGQPLAAGCECTFGPATV